MLKSAYRSLVKGGSMSGFSGMRGQARPAGISQTPYTKKGNDLNFSSPYSTNISPDLGMIDNEKKMERSQRRWETVMSHKQANTEAKYKAMKDMLAKKFKREKDMAENMKLANEDMNNRILDRKDKFDGNRERKRTQDLKLE